MQRTRFDFDVITGPAAPRPELPHLVPTPGPKPDNVNRQPRQEQQVVAKMTTPLSATPA